MKPVRWLCLDAIIATTGGNEDTYFKGSEMWTTDTRARHSHNFSKDGVCERLI